ncbi:MAG: class I SAM-dependent methyltransferase [Melioribacteraceae bacterium]|jgi:ubiquinone/menaquinone biosynthesis C-methylase UbiE|nr:class I SAM-dependent methyltransferase [Melioribacteraceae bacterium]
MEKKTNIFLPGLDNQIRFAKRRLELKGKKTLTLGTSSEEIAKIFANESEEKAELIVEDFTSLMNSRLLIGEIENINVRLMDFEVTDFEKDEFDVVYTQCGISNPRRKKIVKEVKRILKPAGIFCVGEVVSLQEELPQVILDIYDSSELEPLLATNIEDYYRERKFEVIEKKDLSFTLAEFYTKSLYELKKSVVNMEENEKSYYKKLINMISHEAKAFLNQGADEYIGFYSLMLKKL